MTSDTLRLNEKGGLAMHNMTGLLGAAVGVAIAAVIWAVVVSLRKERSGDAPQFDERQLAARAKAYSSAFFTLLGHLAVVALLDSVAEVRWAARSTRSSGRRRIRKQPPLPLKSARKFAKISPLRCKKAGCPRHPAFLLVFSPAAGMRRPCRWRKRSVRACTRSSAGASAREMPRALR